MLEGMGFLQAEGSGKGACMWAVAAVVWNAVVLAVWAGAITAGVLIVQALL